MKLPVISLRLLAGSNGFGGRDIVWTGSNADGRFVVVEVVVSGAKMSGGGLQTVHKLEKRKKNQLMCKSYFCPKKAVECKKKCS